MPALLDLPLAQLAVDAARLSFVGAVSLFLVVAVSDYLDGWRKRRQLGEIPIVDEGSNMSRLFRWNRPGFDLEKAIYEAYNKYSKAGKPFAARLQHEDYAIALPPSSGKEWRAIGHTQLSFLNALSEFADLSPHINVLSRTPIEAVHSCNNTSTIEKFQQLLAAETDIHLPPAFNPHKSPERGELNTLSAVFSASSAIATSLILGSNTPNAPGFTANVTGYNDLMIYSRLLRVHYPWILRPLVWYFAPPCRQLRSHLSILRKLLTPEVKRRVGTIRRGGLKPQESSRSFSLLDILIETTFNNGTLSRFEPVADENEQIDILVQNVLLYHFELARPTGMNITFMLYTIMNHPEYIAPLREEINGALNRFGGVWVPDLLAHAPKLESFCKETFRLHDISQFVNVRRVMQPLHLESVNLSLKPGTLIMTPCRPVHLDAEHYKDPTAFDGFRFYDAASNTCTPRVSTTSPIFLSFSHGTGTCPARNFASQIARTVFIKLLLQYDFELALDKMPQYGRVDGGIYFPNPAVMMRVRPREREI
ncbi:cytochrome P450 [Aspergillus crustosus]